jgi:hypothetical protein
VDNTATPAVDATANQLLISMVPPGNVNPTATMGAVSSVSMTVDRSSNNVYATWVQSIDDDAVGGGVPDVVPVSATLLAGAGLFQESVALVDPNTDANAAETNGNVILRLSATGALHAAWVGTDAADASLVVRHRVRTGTSTWSSAPAGDEVSSVTAGILLGDLLLAGDGDAYAVWADGAANVRTAWRAAGDASTFGTPVDVVTGLANLTEVAAALEPGTEYLHVFWKVVSGADVSFHSRNYPAANLTGTTWSATDDLRASLTSTGSTKMVVWADSANRVVFACQAPLVDGDLNRILLRTRPTGAASVYSAVVDLTAPFVLPCSGLTVAIAASGTAILVWEQGSGDDLPLSDVFGAVYASGGGVGGTGNISSSASTGSQDPFVLRMTDALVGHVFWQETTAAPDIRDVSYARTK